MMRLIVKVALRTNFPSASKAGKLGRNFLQTGSRNMNFQAYGYLKIRAGSKLQWVAQTLTPLAVF
jgi:hypothetical protein